MIASLRGRATVASPTRIIVDVQGVGYEVHIPISTFEAVNRPGEEIFLLTYLHVREDALQLYGFATEKERALFLKLISLSGIGPRVALGILSSTRVEEFQEYIRQGDVPRLKALPGIGKKTAERLILELKDSFPDSRREATEKEEGLPPNLIDEATLALVSLGYSQVPVEKTLRQLVATNSVSDVETLIKLALRHL